MASYWIKCPKCNDMSNVIYEIKEVKSKKMKLYCGECGNTFEATYGENHGEEVEICDTSLSQKNN